METIYVVLLALLVLYVPFYLYVRKSPKMRERGIVPYGPLVMFRTKWGINAMGRLSRHRRFWRFFGLLSKITSLALMITIVAIMALNVIALPKAIGREGIGIEYALAIPGLNPMLPLWYGILGLIVAMAVHELAHGIQARANDVGVASTGLLYGVVPLGAFVEMEQEDVEKAGRRERMDLYSAGITTNLIAAVAIFALMAGALGGGLVANDGDCPAIVAMAPGSPGLDGGIPIGSIITSVNGTAIASESDFEAAVDHYGTYALGYRARDGSGTATLKMGVLIQSVVPGSPAYTSGMKGGTFIKSVDGDGFGTIDGFRAVIADYSPGDKDVKIVTVDKDGVEETHTITFAEKNGKAFLGVVMTNSGFAFTTPNENLRGAINPLHDSDSLTSMATSALTYLGGPFRGYSPLPESTFWWYESQWVSDDVFWIAVSALFWIFWLNLVLGLSNALPAVPFDGGFLFMGGVDWILERMGVEGEARERKVATAGSIATNVSLLVLILVVVTILI
ncbi:MAG: site-2 protease family protein [Thermoplasmatales archaeon]|nr:site-2 protease family protein [Thermoplasmatales archaeon]